MERLTLVVKNAVIKRVNKLIKIFFFALIFNQNNFAAFVEDFFNTQGPKVTLVGTTVAASPYTSSGISNDLFVDPMGSNTSSESNPITVYVPIANPDGTPNNLNYTLYSTNGGKDRENFFTKEGTDYYGLLQFNFNIALEGDAFRYLKVAWNDDGTWKDFTGTSEQGGPTQLTSDGQYVYQVPFNQICGTVDNSNFDCDTIFENTVDNPSATGEFQIFAYLDTDSGTDSDVNVSDFRGTYYTVKLSNQIISSGRIFLNNISKGDTKLFINFTGFDFSDDIQQTFVYLTENSSTEDANSAQTMADLSLTRGNLTDIDSTITDGNITVDELENDVTYSIRLVYCDKFGFCSTLSNALSETPESLEALLQAQACYLLTAGFEGGHPIIDFFRKFRDRILSKYFFGQAFTTFYYNTAPLLTGYINNSPKLKKAIRVFAKIMYGVFKFWWVWPTLLIAGLMLFIRRGEEYGRS